MIVRELKIVFFNFHNVLKNTLIFCYIALGIAAVAMASSFAASNQNQSSGDGTKENDENPRQGASQPGGVKTADPEKTTVAETLVKSEECKCTCGSEESDGELPEGQTIIQPSEHGKQLRTFEPRFTGNFARFLCKKN